MSDYLADLDDLLDLLGDGADPAKAELALRRASDDFRGAVRHHVSLVEDDVAVLDGDGTRVALLPQAPVVDVAEVKVDGNVVDVEWSRHGLLRSRRRFPDRLRAIEVTYTHGYETIPGDIASAVLDRAEHAYHVSPGLSSMQVGGQTLSWSAGAAEGLAQEWLSVVEAHRLNRGDEA